MNPILKYSGGKRKEVRYFLKYIPQSYDTYIEPFLGGGALYFSLNPGKAVINDLNQRLMDFYRELRADFDTVHSQLKDIRYIYQQNRSAYVLDKESHRDDAAYRAKNANEDLYYLMRRYYNGEPSPYLWPTIYYTINHLAFAGITRYNRDGQYNTPFGHYANFPVTLTRDHKALLNRSQILCADFELIFQNASGNDFMFLDPPYDTTYHHYGNVGVGEDFGEDEHRRLAAAFKNSNCKTLLVIGKTPLTQGLYRNYIVEEYQKEYTVNIRNRFTSGNTHMLVCNYSV